jgi:hypothetical protein
MRKYSIMLLLALAVVSARAETNVCSTVNALATAITNAYTKQDVPAMSSLMYKEGVPPEILAVTTNIPWDFATGPLPVTNVQIKAFADYKPPMPLPGQYNGKALKWVPMPTHWIIVSQGKMKNEIRTETQAQYPVAMKNGVWWIVGITYDNFPNKPSATR